MVEQGPHPEAREALGRAIRRLDILEYFILGAIAILSLLGGALVAFLAVQLVGVPFRATWAVSSILIFVIPAAVVWGREVRPGRTPSKQPDAARPESENNG